MRAFRAGAAALGIGWLLTGAVAAQDVPANRIAWPVYGQFDADEGTIEFWIRFAFEPLEPGARYRGHGTVFHIGFGDPVFPADRLDGSLHTVEVGARSRSGMDLRWRSLIVAGGLDVMHPTVVSFGPQVRRDKWIHVAVTWSGRERVLKVYYNGKFAAEREFFSHREYAPAVGPDAVLLLGSSPDQAPAPRQFALAEVRLSAVARPPEQLGFADGPLTPDRHTLLLIDFAAATAAEPLRPTYAARADWETREVPLPAFVRRVPGPDGRTALAFYEE